MLRVTSKQYGNEFNDFTIDWLKNCIGEKIPFTINFEVETATKAWADNLLTYAPGAYITNDYIQTDNDSFQEFYQGDTIKIADSVITANSGTYKIREKIDNATLRLYKSDGTAASFTSGQTTDNAKIFVVDVVDKVRFNFNFIENDEPVNYTSKVTGETQQVEKDKLDASDTSTLVDLIFQGEKSWQIGDIVTELGDCSIKGNGIDQTTTYISKFILTGTFWLTPFNLVDQWDNLSQIIAPDYFFDFNALKLVFKIQGAYKNRSYQFSQSFEESEVFGDSAWFDETFNNSPTNYYVDSCVFKKTDTTIVSSLQLTTNEIDFTIVIKNTVDSPFSFGNPFTCNFCIAPDSDTIYKGNDVKNNTLDFNFRFDRLLSSMGASVVNGEKHGVTGRQVFEGVSASVDSSSQITVTGKIICDSTLVDFLLGLDNPRYMIWITLSKALVPPARIPVGDHPEGIARNSDRQLIYIINSNDNTISVIDETTNLVVKTFSIHTNNESPEGTCYNPVNKYLYVVGKQHSYVSFYNCASSEAFVGDIHLNDAGGGNTWLCCYDSTQNYVVVVCDSGTRFYIIRCSDNTKLFNPNTLPAGYIWYDTIYTGGITAWIVGGFGALAGKLVKVTTTTGAITTYNLPTSFIPQQMAYDGVSKIYITDRGNNNVIVFDTGSLTVVKTITGFTATAYAISYNTTDKLFYISSSSGDIYTYDPISDSLTLVFTLTAVMNLFLYDSANNTTYSVNTADNSVYAIKDISLSKDDRVALMCSVDDYYIERLVTGLVTQDSHGWIEAPFQLKTDKITTLDSFTEDEIVDYTRIKIDLSLTPFTKSIKQIRAGIKAKNSITGDSFELDSLICSFVGSSIINSLEFINETIIRGFKAPLTDAIKNFIVSRDLISDSGNSRFYDVYFPFLNRWEYWIENLSTNTAFFDISLPNNGLNEDWQKFDLLVNWSLYSFVETIITVDGEDQTYTLENAFLDEPYDANTAYTTVITTKDSNGITLNNSGTKYLSGYGLTTVQVDFTYIGGGTPPDLSKIGMMFRLESFEEGGYLASTRINSYRASGSESQWQASDSSGLIVVTSPSSGAYRGIACIDNGKLQNSQEFSITARLYDTSPAIGQAHKENFFVINSQTTDIDSTAFVTKTIPQTPCFTLPVFGDSGGTDGLKNDFTSVFFGYSNNVTAVTLYLLKNGVVTKTLNDNTYGTFYAYGFQDDGIKKYTGYQINWRTILLDGTLGQGQYQVKAHRTLMGGSTKDEYWFPYYLQQFTSSRADNTTRFEFWQNNICGDWQIDTDFRNFTGLNWYNSIRFPKSIAWSEETPFQIEEIQYTNGNIQDQYMEQTPTYEFIIKPLPIYIHRFMRVEILTADTIVCTDYNYRSPIAPFVYKRITFVGNHKPDYSPRAINSDVRLTFKQKINNLRKRYGTVINQSKLNVGLLTDGGIPLTTDGGIPIISD